MVPVTFSLLPGSVGAPRRERGLGGDFGQIESLLRVATMPRRNLFVIVAVAVVCLLCYQKAERGRFGRVLVDAMEQIDRRYVEPVAPAELFAGAMEGMVARLNDPYSAYIDPEQLRKFNEAIDARFGGVGIQVALDPKTGELTVISPLPGTPAHRGGIRPGDRILRIDRRSTQGLSLEDAVVLLRGKPGESVILTVLHPGEQTPVDLPVVREVIQVETVLGDLHHADGSWDFFLQGQEGIGYVRITNFAEHTSGELEAALAELVEGGMQGLILDLRDNPGGLLRSAVEASDLFVKDGVIVSTRSRGGVVRDSFIARPGNELTGFLMVVLVNRYTASAGEIVAACLQDYQLAAVVGERTWGKGTVQEVIELDARAGALRLTTATYWRPSGKNIHKPADQENNGDWGVRPDEGCEVVVDNLALVRLREQRHRRDVYHPHGAVPEELPDILAEDPQLRRAVECLEEKLQGP